MIYYFLAKEARKNHVVRTTGVSTDIAYYPQGASTNYGESEKNDHSSGRHQLLISVAHLGTSAYRYAAVVA